jgi:hypothetical protein
MASIREVHFSEKKWINQFVSKMSQFRNMVVTFGWSSLGRYCNYYLTSIVCLFDCLAKMPLTKSIE